ncbi:hypothetical protein [Chryseobacterium gallinarum]|uniref:Uncharacterized protein n=1 Tax=Chryseobacterium gallinarum TaxID=1324352 RepID=A0ABX6KUH2_CHRGL|nr:hypothetical protein [Chryseobacterium gallinarum]QIY92200.1 hypothetical protein FOB44_16710 [Chryseobacterium gallinarum]
MEFKGTKGKWRIEKDYKFPTLHNIWSDQESILNNGTLIARTCYAPLSESNALLISKAPEMLEMLNIVLMHDPCHYSERWDKLIKDVEKVIKEATEI